MTHKISLTIVVFFLLVNVSSASEQYTFEEVEVAKVICAEAVGEGKIGMWGVSNIIFNRMKMSNISAYEVVTKKNQFSGYTAKNKEKLFAQGKEYALFLGHNIEELKDITKGALFFKREEEKRQKWHKIFCVKINNHEFWK